MSNFLLYSDSYNLHQEKQCHLTEICALALLIDSLALLIDLPASHLYTERFNLSPYTNLPPMHIDVKTLAPRIKTLKRVFMKTVQTTFKTCNKERC